MSLFLVAVGILLAGGVTALLLGRWAMPATLAGAGSAVIGCAAGVVPAVRVLAHGRAESLHLPWSVPFGAFHVQIDPLSAFFALPIVALCAAAAVYGGEYLLAYRQRRNLGAAWFFYNVLVASMLLVVVARNGVLFLVAWEVMSLASFFLVTFEHESEHVRRAGWTYLVATHAGTGFLILLFALLGSRAGSLDFDAFAAAGGSLAGVATPLLLCAVIGFGTKAGFVPLHVWLPEAHPAAPSHVSAVMSGVMLKTGIYGLMRVLTLLPEAEAWWGWLLVGIGLVSGILGVLLALAQHDLKRLLAYHSVENIGIITLGSGIGLVGAANGWPVVATLGIAGGLLHVANHATFKGLLFLGAGAVLHGTGSREIDEFGGLLKRLPVTALTFLVGSAAISGLPPFNGFVSEFLIYIAALRGTTVYGMSMALPGLAALAGLALIGGLAAACFTKAFGITFLGEPRTQRAASAHAPGLAMQAPMVVLAAGCLAMGLAGPWIVQAIAPAVAQVIRQPLPEVTANLAMGTVGLLTVTIVSLVLLGLVAGLALLRRALLAGRPIGAAGTWDCGYAAPTARMQYTASSFAQPLVSLFRPFLRTRQMLTPPAGLFPSEAEMATTTPDPFTEGLYRPAFAGLEYLLSKLRWLQQGRVQLYVLYIALTLLVLLVWKLG